MGCREISVPFGLPRKGFRVHSWVSLPQPEFLGSSTVPVCTLSTPVGVPCLLGHFCLV